MVPAQKSTRNFEAICKIELVLYFEFQIFLTTLYYQSQVYLANRRVEEQKTVHFYLWQVEQTRVQKT